MDYSLSIGSAPQSSPNLRKFADLYDDTVCTIKPRSSSLLVNSGYIVDWAGRQVVKASYVEACYFAERLTHILHQEGTGRAEEYFYTA